jgi:hypothetical protein
VRGHKKILPTEREWARSGPRDEKPVGSVPWCWQTIDLLKWRWKRKDFTDQQFEETLDELRQQQVWKMVPPERPYGSLKALLEAEIGCSEEDARKQLEAHPTGSRPQGGRPQTDNLSVFTQQGRATKNRIGIVSQRKLDFLAGHREDLLHEVQDGALSIHAAYQRAKGQTPDTPFDALLRAWRRVSREDRRRFLREYLNDEEQYELAQELAAIDAT